MSSDEELCLGARLFSILVRLTSVAHQIGWTYSTGRRATQEDLNVAKAMLETSVREAEAALQELLTVGIGASLIPAIQALVERELIKPGAVNNELMQALMSEAAENALSRLHLRRGFPVEGTETLQ